MHPQTFTVGQANALIPWLTDMFARIREKVQELLALRVQAASGETRMDPQGAAQAEPISARMASLEAEIKESLEEASALGVEVRRVDGLVDFPAWHEGEMVYLCWQLGEAEVQHFHPTSEGFRGRRRLPKIEPAELN